MNDASFLNQQKGFSVVELILYSAIASWMGLVIARYAGLPTHLTSFMNTVNNEQGGYSSTSVPIADLKSAVSASIQWDSIDPTKPNPPYNPAVNSQFMAWFQVSDPSQLPPAMPISYVCYWYRASDQSVLREFIPGGPPTASAVTQCAPVAGDNAQESIIAKNVLPPTAQTPLFVKDATATNVVVMTMQIPCPGNANSVATIVRRAHVRS